MSSIETKYPAGVLADFEPLSLDDVAGELGYSARHIRHLCEQGEFGRKQGEKNWVVFRWEVDAYKRLPRTKPGPKPNPGGLAD